MRHFTSTQTQFAAPNFGSSSDTAEPLSQCALQITRAVIARWSGTLRPASALAKDLPRISPQARWLSQAQCGLAEWIAAGGFSRPDDDGDGSAAPPTEASLPAHIYQVPGTDLELLSPSVNACVD